MSRVFFRNMNKHDRENFWLNLYNKYQTYPGTLVEFLKEHEVSATAFNRWSQKFKAQQQSIIDKKTTEHNSKHPAFAKISDKNKHIQQSIDEIDEVDLEVPYEDYDKESNTFADNNDIMGSMEIILPQGTKIRLTNHADLSMVARLIGMVNQHA